MALPATLVNEIRPTAGNATNGMGFDPNLTGCTPDTVGAVSSANTTAPVFSSANWTAVSGDIRAWWFGSAGTNLIPGWYKISGVASGQATLTATIGSGVLYKGGNISYSASTVAGVSASASLTSLTWTVDYSQQNAFQTQGTNESSSTTTVTNTASITTVAWVGNCIYGTGTGFTTGRYLVTAVGTLSSGLTATFTIDRSAGATGTAITYQMGGAIDTNNNAFAATGGIGSNTFWLQNSGTLSISGAQTAAPTGAAGGLPTLYIGYNVQRGDLDSVQTYANFPTITSNNVTNTLLPGTNGRVTFMNLILTGGSGGTKSAAGMNTAAGGFVTCINIKASGFTAAGFEDSVGTGTNNKYVRCWATAMISGATGGFYTFASRHSYCLATANPCHGFAINDNGSGANVFDRCISANNTGATSDGISTAGTGSTTMSMAVTGCLLYNNGRHGLNLTSSETNAFDGTSIIYNNIFWGSAAATSYGVKSTTDYSANPYAATIDYNVFGNFTNSYLFNAQAMSVFGPHDQLLSVDPTTNGAGGVFTLNNTAGGGAVVRGAAYPGTYVGAAGVGSLDAGPLQSASSAATPLNKGLRSGSKH